MTFCIWKQKDINEEENLVGDTFKAKCFSASQLLCVDVHSSSFTLSVRKTDLGKGISENCPIPLAKDDNSCYVSLKTGRTSVTESCFVQHQRWHALMLAVWILRSLGFVSLKRRFLDFSFIMMQQTKPLNLNSSVLWENHCFCKQKTYILWKQFHCKCTCCGHNFIVIQFEPSNVSRSRGNPWSVFCKFHLHIVFRLGKVEHWTAESFRKTAVPCCRTDFAAEKQYFNASSLRTHSLDKKTTPWLS